LFIYNSSSLPYEKPSYVIPSLFIVSLSAFEKLGIIGVRSIGKFIVFPELQLNVYVKENEKQMPQITAKIIVFLIKDLLTVIGSLIIFLSSSKSMFTRLKFNSYLFCSFLSFFILLNESFDNFLGLES